MDFLERLGNALAGGAESLGELWDSLPESDYARRLIVAHYLADVQENLTDEVRWDETALLQLDWVLDSDLQALHPSLTILGFVPSLQLNLADGYRRLGRFDEAARALGRSVAYNDRLPVELPEQEEYRQVIMSAQQRVRELIEARDSSDTMSTS